MTTYHLSIHKICGFCRSTDPLESRHLQLDNEQDFTQAKRLCENQKNMAGFWKQTVLPIRNQASDLFFPTLMNMVMKTKTLAENVWAILGAIIWDLATLPIRLVTFLPRRGYEAMTTPTEHPLIPYLKRKGVYSNSLATDGKVTVILYTKELKEDRTKGNRAEEHCESYLLYLTDREIPFPLYKKTMYSYTRPLESWD